jgi:hypothetical protein
MRGKYPAVHERKIFGSFMREKYPNVHADLFLQ